MTMLEGASMTTTLFNESAISLSSLVSLAQDLKGSWRGGLWILPCKGHWSFLANCLVYLISHTDSSTTHTQQDSCSISHLVGTVITL